MDALADGTYTTWFNWRHQKRAPFPGPLQESAGGKGRVFVGVKPLTAPRSGTGETPRPGDPAERRRRLREYRWSSFAATRGLEEPAEFVSEELVLEEFAPGKRRWRESKVRYRRFVEKGLVDEMANPTDAARRKAVLGSEDFL